MTRITDFFTTFTKIRFGRRALRHRGWTEAGPVLSKNEPFRRKIIKIYDYVCKRNLHPTPQRLVRQDGQRLILIPGNMLTPNNYLNNAYYFRQAPRSSIISDSTPRHWSA